MVNTDYQRFLIQNIRWYVIQKALINDNSINRLTWFGYRADNYKQISLEIRWC